jgi:predicted NBD/HSP70 family sugar kinase
MYRYDQRIVVTLDAGGTNLVFSAMQGCKFIIDPITYPSNAQDLDLCLETMVKGFTEVIGKLPAPPVAISFAFPGPADYVRGIIGGYLPNFPSFRDGVALGPFLERKFGLPVYINNDGDLFAYGEALCGALPEINQRLADAGSSKQYRNLLGYTFGTGFGIGMVIDNRLNRGDNSCVETFCLPHKHNHEVIVEEGVAVRAIKRVYAERSGYADHNYEPKDICMIAKGEMPGDSEAAKKAFEVFGEVAGDAMASAVTLVDGLIVIGGGITAAKEYIMPALLKELRGDMKTLKGETLKRVQMSVYDLDNPDEFDEFAHGDNRRIKIYGTDEFINYDPKKRIGVCISKLGASQAISVGAYAFALSQIDANTPKDPKPGHVG